MTGFELDRTSLLACVDASLTLGEIEDALMQSDLTLGIADLESHRQRPLGTWLSEGALGAPDPWLDPADHLVAGLDATLPDGSLLSIRPAPRRSTGPDLTALSLGARGRFMQIARVWLRVHPRGVSRPRTAPFHAERNPPVSSEEEALFAAIEAELAKIEGPTRVA